MKKLYLLVFFSFYFFQCQSQVLDSIFSMLPQAVITGSGYNANCFGGGDCAYNVMVYVPGGITIKDIKAFFEFEALGSCDSSKGAIKLEYGSCSTPWMSGGKIDQSIFNDLQSCLPAPQTTPYYLNMVLRFARCVDPGAGCGFSCINASGNLRVGVYFDTCAVKVFPSDTTVCSYSSVQLQDSVGPNASCHWSPSTLLNDPDICNPLAAVIAPITYTVTVTEGTCTATATAAIHVYPAIPVPVIILDHDSLFFSFDSSYASIQWFEDGVAIPNATDTFFVPTHNGIYSLQLCDSNECCIEVNIGCLGCGVRELNADLIVVSPNPADEKLMVKGVGTVVRAEIYTVIGSVLLDAALRKDDFEIDVSSLPPGIYFLHLSNDTGSVVKRFLKE